MSGYIEPSEFVKEAWDDFNSPTTSSFMSRIGDCKRTVSHLEETLDVDRTGLSKMKKSIKALYNSGTTHVSNEAYFAESLEKLGSSAKDQEENIGGAFNKFAVIAKDLSALMKNLMSHLNNTIMFPLDSFMKGDLRGMKDDYKRPFDKATKEYENKYLKIKKELEQSAREAGMIREVKPQEIAEDLERERRFFQLQACEYLLKVSEIKTKKGTDLLQHLVEFYQAQNTYFQEGLRTIQHYSSYIEELNSQISKIKLRQDSERRNLTELRDALKGSMAAYKDPVGVTPGTSGYNLHQLQGNKSHGTEKRGYLLKRSEGKLKKMWQKRLCSVKEGSLAISHSDESKDPVRLNLLTCQVKLIPDDPGKKCFDLISSSKNRTYHFQADDEFEMESWISVLNNAKESVLLEAFGDTGKASSMKNSVRELRTGIMKEIQRLQGNNICCDCSAADPEWLSTNLGVLICLECCGIHREMGVHISRTQSIIIDEIGTAQLLIARVMSNQGFNDIFEATLPSIDVKPRPDSNIEEKKDFIRAKYERRRYVRQTCTNREEIQEDLRQAVLSRDIFQLLQVMGEGADLMAVLADNDYNETALHLAITQEEGSTLFLVDFIVQNSNSETLKRTTTDGNTALHLCALYRQTECMKLLLRVKPDLAVLENNSGKTALDIARKNGNQLCIDMLTHALSGKTELFENVNIDWGLMHTEGGLDAVDYSDDELDEKEGRRSRPSSIVSQESMQMPPPPSFQTPGSRPSLMPPAPPSQQAKHKSGITNRDVNLRRKGPAPPPPPGHTRVPSDPNTIRKIMEHKRTSSDPPPLPEKSHRKVNERYGSQPSGLAIFPPPAQFKDNNGRPKPAPRTVSRALSKEVEDQLIPNDVGAMLDEGIDPPRPQPRNRKKIVSSVKRGRRCRAIYDCEADKEDELSFRQGDVILWIREDEEDKEWAEGEIEGDPSQRGMFPVSFVHMLND